MKRFIVNLPDDVHERLREQSFKTRKSMSELIVAVLSAEENVPSSTGPISRGGRTKEDGGSEAFAENASIANEFHPVPK